MFGPLLFDTKIIPRKLFLQFPQQPITLKILKTIKKKFRFSTSIPQGNNTILVYCLHFRFACNWNLCLWMLLPFLSISTERFSTSFLLQSHLDILCQWFTKLKIKINNSKSFFITFALRLCDFRPVNINDTIISHSSEVKYLGLTLDRCTTWVSHLKNKRKKLNCKLHL